MFGADKKEQIFEKTVSLATSDTTSEKLIKILEEESIQQTNLFKHNKIFRCRDCGNIMCYK